MSNPYEAAAAIPAEVVLQMRVAGLEAKNATLKQELDEACELYAREAHKRIVQEEAASVEIAALKQERDAFKQDAIDRAADCFEAGVKHEAVTAERDRLREALTTAEQVLDAAQIAFRGRDMDSREMQIMQACQIARDAARFVLVLSPSETEEGG